MNQNNLLRNITITGIAFCIAALAIVSVQLTEDLIRLVSGYAAGISRLTP